MKTKVFIADDHTVVRDGLRALLEAHPEIEVVGDASDGRQAVNQIMALNPDVVIMDISMPELNGIDATNQVLEYNPKLGVIILSILGTTEHVFRALQAGVKGYLLKESAGREVVDAVLCVASGKRYLSQPITDTRCWFRPSLSTRPRFAYRSLSTQWRTRPWCRVSASG